MTLKKTALSLSLYETPPLAFFPSRRPRRDERRKRDRFLCAWPKLKRLGGCCCRLELSTRRLGAFCSSQRQRGVRVSARVVADDVNTRRVRKRSVGAGVWRFGFLRRLSVRPAESAELASKNQPFWARARSSRVFGVAFSTACFRFAFEPSASDREALADLSFERARLRKRAERPATRVSGSRMVEPSRPCF